MNASELTKELFYKPKHGYDLLDAQEVALLNAYNEEYKHFLNDGRTERECVKIAVQMAKDAGFVEYEVGMPMEPGTKIYRNIRNKSLLLAVMGEKPLSEGCVIAGADGIRRSGIFPYPLLWRYPQVPVGCCSSGTARCGCAEER